MQWKIWLVVAHGPNEGDTIPVEAEGRFLIGRRSGCQFRPAGEGVADLHCALLARGNRFFLRNFNLPHGTSVGGRIVLGAMELRDDDRFQVGQWHLQVRIVPCPLAEASPAEPEPPAITVPAAIPGDVSWVGSCLDGASELFVACSSVPSMDDQTPSSSASCAAAAPLLDMPAAPPNAAELPVLELVEEPPPAAEAGEATAAGTLAETAASDETADPAANATQTESLPTEIAETTCALPSVEPPSDAALGAAAETVVEDAAPGTVAEPAPEMIPETVTHQEETTYRPLAALESESGTDTPAVPHKPRRSSSSSPMERSSPIETGRPKKAAADIGAERLKGRRLLVGRLDRAMPTLRQQEWEEATEGRVVIRSGPPRKTWKNWLPPMAGMVVGMVLVGGVFCLATLRASPGPLPTPPRGRLHTGRMIVVQEPDHQAEQAPLVGQRRATIQGESSQGVFPQDGPRVRRRSPTTNP